MLPRKEYEVLFKRSKEPSDAQLAQAINLAIAYMGSLHYLWSRFPPNLTVYQLYVRNDYGSTGWITVSRWRFNRAEIGEKYSFREEIEQSEL